MPVVGYAPAIAHVGLHTTRLTVSRACTAAGGAKARVEGVVRMFTVCCALQAARRRSHSFFFSLELRAHPFACTLSRRNAFTPDFLEVPRCLSKIGIIAITNYYNFCGLAISCQM